MDFSNLTLEQAERIEKMHKEGYACSAIIRDMAEELGIKEREINYPNGYRLIREAFQYLKYNSSSPSNID